MPEGEERGDSFEDLFEDLDRFFAPADPAERRRRQAQQEPGAAGAGPEGAGPSSGEEARAEEGDDLLPPGWEPDLGGLELPAEPEEDPVAPEAVAREEAGPLREEPRGETEVAASGSGSPGPGSSGPQPIEPEPVEPEPLEPEPVAPTPIEPEPIEPEPIEPEPIEPEPIESAEPEPVEPEPIEPSPPQSQSAEEAVPEPPAHHPHAPEAEEEEAARGTAPSGSRQGGEMTGPEWTRLRDVLGDEEGEELEFLTEPAGELADESLFDYGSEAEPADMSAWRRPEEEHELTLEDLKKAPPEYRGLPRSEDEPESGHGVATPAAPGAEEPYWEEPAIADVEAAADQIAAEFREAEPSGVEQDLLADLEPPGAPRTIKVGQPESMSGPTWEEPTSRPIMHEPPPGPSGFGRNMPAAILTGVALAAVALIALAIAKAAFAVVGGGAVLLGQAELYATMHRRGHQPATALGLVIGGLMIAGAYLKGEQAILFFLALGFVLCLLWYMAAAPKAREGMIRNIGSTMLGVAYVPFLAGYVFLLLAQANKGRALMLTILALTFVYDIAAFAVGSLWGRRPLAPTISPKKSWEGLFGATVVTVVLTAALVPSIIDYLTIGKAMALALVIVVAAPLGDLAESALKRDLGVKDMGSLLPGHGGVLDRIDSILFVAPAVFYFLRLIF